MLVSQAQQYSIQELYSLANRHLSGRKKKLLFISQATNQSIFGCISLNSHNRFDHFVSYLKTSTKNFSSYTNPITYIVRQATLNGRTGDKKYEMKYKECNDYTNNSAKFHFNGLAFIFQLNGKISNRKCFSKCCKDLIASTKKK